MNVRTDPASFVMAWDGFVHGVFAASDELVEVLLYNKMRDLIHAMARSRLAGGVTAKIAFDLEDSVERVAYPLMVKGLKDRGYIVEENKDTSLNAGFVSVTWPQEKSEDEQPGTT